MIIIKILVGRIEGDHAIVETEDSQFYRLPTALIPNVREGDTVNIDVDTQSKDEKIKTIMNSFWENID